MITPSTDLKFDPGLKGKSKLNYLRNYWLLIGKSAPRGTGGDLLPPCGQETTLPVTALSSVLGACPRWSFRPRTISPPRKTNQASCVTKSVLRNHLTNVPKLQY